jgi:hypothetical protein
MDCIFKANGGFFHYPDLRSAVVEHISLGRVSPVDGRIKAVVAFVLWCLGSTVDGGGVVNVVQILDEWVEQIEVCEW